MDRRVRTDGSGFGLVVGHGHPSMDVEVEVVPVTHNPSGGVDTPRGSLEGSTLDGIVVVELGELVVCPEEGIGPSLGIAAGTYDLYAFVVEFPPGSGTPRHIHGGPVVVTVISGELVLQRSVGERILRAGDSVIENPGDVHALINRSATAARIAASELIPKGAAETTIVK